MNPIIKINNEKRTLEQLVFFDSLDENNFMERAIENELIKQESYRRNITINNDEIKDYLENYKKKHGIDSPEKFNLWLENRHLSYEKLFQTINLVLTKEKLINSISEDELEIYFNENRAGFDEINYHSFSISDEWVAETVVMQVKSGKIAFRLSEIQKICEDTSITIQEFIGWVSRKHVISSIEEVILNPDWESNCILGPFKFHNYYNIYQVLDIHFSDFRKDKIRIRESYFKDYIFKLKLFADIRLESFK